MAFPDRDIERGILAMLLAVYPSSMKEEQVKEETTKKFGDSKWSYMLKELSYLRDKKLIEIEVIERDDQIVGKRYSITAKGIDVSSGTKL